MSGHEQARWHITALTYECRTCGAPPGQPCITDRDRVRHTEVHVDRTRQASLHNWLPADATCTHCHDDPPLGHTCPRCGRRTP